MSSSPTGAVPPNTSPTVAPDDSVLIFRRPHSPGSAHLSAASVLPAAGSVTAVPTAAANPTPATPAAVQVVAGAQAATQAAQAAAQAAQAAANDLPVVPKKQKPVPPRVMHPSRVPKMLPPVGMAGFFSINPWAAPICTALAVLVPLGVGAAALTATVVFCLLPMEIPAVVLFSACAAGAMAAVIGACLLGLLVWGKLQVMIMLHNGREVA